MISSNEKIKPKHKKIHIKHVGRISFWFLAGASIAIFLITSFSYFGFQKYYNEKVYPGVKINGVDFSRKSQEEVEKYFINKNETTKTADLVFSFEDEIATISAKEAGFGYDEKLLADQAMSIGRSKDPLSNVSIIIQAYTQGINLSPSYKFSQENLDTKLNPLYEKINKDPIEALFNFEDGRVKEFRESQNGQQVDRDKLNEEVISKAQILVDGNEKKVFITIPVKTVKPNLTTDKVNKMGIKELVGSGTSTYQHSIENRIFNVALAASRVNGTLVAPGETFSFAKTVGDVSNLTGYKQAYVISGGKTVLGDGGGVCQVSTTLFRAVLNAGLPVEERHAHAYRVGYYEQDSGPGIDATVYVPTVDFKFKNDTGHHILIQSIIDPEELRLTFMLYGTKDGRISVISDPVITNQTPAPEAKYEDDPSLPIGQVKQVDFAANGANVYFTRTVTKDGKTIISEKYTSNYRPWQAVFLRGTKPI